MDCRPAAEKWPPGARAINKYARSQCLISAHTGGKAPKIEKRGVGRLRGVELDLAERWRALDRRLLPVDKRDIQILSILVRNARETNSRIAAQLHVTEATVRRRVKALKEKGLILAFTTVINFSAVENTVKSFIHLQVSSDRLREVVQKLRQHPRVTAIHRVTGPHNILLVALFVSTSELQDFVDNFLRMEGVRDTVVQIVMSSHKEQHWGGI